MDSTRRAGGADSVAGYKPIAAEHVDVVAERLKVVHHEVACDVAFVVERSGLAIDLLRQVTAETARIPRRMAGNAAHALVLMSTLMTVDAFIGVRRAAPEQLAAFVPPHGLRC